MTIENDLRTFLDSDACVAPYVKRSSSMPACMTPLGIELAIGGACEEPTRIYSKQELNIIITEAELQRFLCGNVDPAEEAMLGALVMAAAPSETHEIEVI